MRPRTWHIKATGSSWNFWYKPSGAILGHFDQNIVQSGCVNRFAVVGTSMRIFIL
jgi:hypothetical protein